MLVFICKVWRGAEQVRSVRLVCGWGRKGTENLTDSPGVTQLEDEVPKCSIHREYSVLGDEREFGDFPGVAAPCVSASARPLLGLQHMPSFWMGQELWKQRRRAGVARGSQAGRAGCSSALGARG